MSGSGRNKRVQKKWKSEMVVDSHTGKLFGSTQPAQTRIMIGIPMTGLLRAEWVIARYGQVIPCNWSQVDCIHWLDQYSPIGFLVADARNVIATNAVEKDVEWLFFVDHDTILPPTTILQWNDRMLKGDVPVWCGLYFTRSVPSEPLIYRGRGTSYYSNWKFGDEVWVDGIPMGCTMIHGSLLKVMYDESPEYEVMGRKVRAIFETPSRTWFDPGKASWMSQTGTEDLEWCSRVIREGVFAKAGWPEYQRKKYPFLVDTKVFCNHIDQNGVQYPSRGEQQQFVRRQK